MIKKREIMKNYQRIFFALSIVIFLFQIYPLKLPQAEENKDKDKIVKKYEKYAEELYSNVNLDKIETTDEELIKYYKYKLMEQADRLSSETIKLREKYRYFAIYGLTASAIIALFLVLFRIKNTEYSPDDVLNATGLIFIIFGTIIVVIIADVGEQLTAAVGILGAIAGYLFGTLRKSKG